MERKAGAGAPRGWLRDVRGLTLPAECRSRKRSTSPKRCMVRWGSTGSYNTPKDVHGEYRGGTIGASPAYSFTAHVAEVDVDTDDGNR